MKTANTYPAERKSVKSRAISFDKMEAIACGVRARLEENTGYSKKVTDETINIARALGVTNTEIERWANHRFSQLAHEMERLKEIKFLLYKVYDRKLSAALKSARG
jgi:hypothetical protein